MRQFTKTFSILALTLMLGTSPVFATDMIAYSPTSGSTITLTNNGSTAGIAVVPSNGSINFLVSSQGVPSGCTETFSYPITGVSPGDGLVTLACTSAGSYTWTYTVRAQCDVYPYGCTNNTITYTLAIN